MRRLVLALGLVVVEVLAVLAVLLAGPSAAQGVQSAPVALAGTGTYSTYRWHNAGLHDIKVSFAVNYYNAGPNGPDRVNWIQLCVTGARGTGEDLTVESVTHDPMLYNVKMVTSRKDTGLNVWSSGFTQTVTGQRCVTRYPNPSTIPGPGQVVTFYDLNAVNWPDPTGTFVVHI